MSYVQGLETPSHLYLQLPIRYELLKQSHILLVSSTASRKASDSGKVFLSSRGTDSPMIHTYGFLFFMRHVRLPWNDDVIWTVGKETVQPV